MNRFESLRAACNDKPHGTRTRYIAGCRCLRCRAANSRYESSRVAARAAGDWNGIVPADEVREHLARLSERGVGYKSVAAAADVSKTVLCGIITGKRKHVRARTERKVLAIDEGAIADKSLVDARPAWKKIRELLNRGFTKVQIAEWLGQKRALQLGRRRMTARSSAAVERMVTLLDAGKLRRTR